MRRSATRGFAGRGGAAADVVGVGCRDASLVWFSYTTRPPPPVILPAAPFASLWLGGALRRLRPLGSRCRACLVGGFPSWVLTCGGAVRGAMWGFGGVASDNRQDSNHRRLGASAEGRLAWPQASSPSGHICKPPRPAQPRVVFPKDPCIPLSTCAACRVPFSDDPVWIASASRLA